MILIGIAGVAGSGKDEVAKRISSKFEMTDRIAFADPLKDEVCKAMGIKREYLEQHKKHFRLILQGWGTDYRRKMFGEDYWTRKWLQRIKESPAMVVVTPDVRFFNEAQLIRALGGYVFKVVRPNNPASTPTHQSESDLDDYLNFDRTIMNTASIERLHVEVDVALEMCGLMPAKQ
jgi:hypothetical protein